MTSLRGEIWFAANIDKSFLRIAAECQWQSEIGVRVAVSECDVLAGRVAPGLRELEPLTMSQGTPTRRASHVEIVL
jgi:hypothetical protein